MSNDSNFPTADTEGQQPRKNFKNVIIGVLAVAFLGTGALYLSDKSKSGETIKHQQTEIATVTDQKSEIQKSFDASLSRLDSMSTLTTNLQGKLTERNKEIAKAKTEIRSILNKKNATAAELSRAKNLIASLNDKITGMEQQVAQLTKDNETLTQFFSLSRFFSLLVELILAATFVLRDPPLRQRHHSHFLQGG
jgi:peptidoglycan hydrolase CwlO-like protein